MTDLYAPCRSCGGRRVVREVVPVGDGVLEFVIVTCASCTVLRARYKRKLSR